MDIGSPWDCCRHRRYPAGMDGPLQRPRHRHMVKINNQPVPVMVDQEATARLPRTAFAWDRKPITTPGGPAPPKPPAMLSRCARPFLMSWLLPEFALLPANVPPGGRQERPHPGQVGKKRPASFASYI